MKTAHTLLSKFRLHPIAKIAWIFPGLALAGLPQDSENHPLKNPFDWPTFWTVEQIADQVISENSESVGPNGIKKLRQVGPNLSDPRTRRFINRLGPLAPQSVWIHAGASKAPSLGATSTPRVPRRWLQTTLVEESPFAGRSQGRSGFLPGECKISYNSSIESEILQPYDRITLYVGRNEGIREGARFRLYEIDAPVYQYGTTDEIGRQIIPNGVVEVMSVKDKTASARLIKCIGTISRQTRAAPISLEAPITVSAYHSTPSDAASARVVWIPESGQIPQQFSHVVIDKGAKAGFRMGDHVALYNQKKGEITDRPLGEGILTHVEEESATLVVHDVLPGVINSGDFAVALQSAEP